MKGITWSRDSHGLFDYESRHLTKRTMKTTQSTQIIRRTNELELIPTSKEVPEDYFAQSETKQLLQIVNDTGKSATATHPLDVFFLESFSQLNSSRVESKEINENMYLVVRSLKHNNQKIVSPLRCANRRLVFRTMKFSKATSSRLAESNLPSKRSSSSQRQQLAQLPWRLTNKSRKSLKRGYLVSLPMSPSKVSKSRRILKISKNMRR